MLLVKAPTVGDRLDRQTLWELVMTPLQETFDKEADRQVGIAAVRFRPLVWQRTR
jgi:hypothetical protein